MKLTLLFLQIILLLRRNEYVSADPKTIQKSLHNISEPVFRAKRAADFNEIHTKLTMAARIFSGISMRIGIHDGSLTADQLISELLNLKSVKPDDVANFDKAKVDGFFTSIGGLNFDPATASTEFENKVIAMNAVLEKYEKISNPDDVSTISAYTDKVKTFPDVTQEFKFLNDIDNAMAATSYLTTIDKGNGDTLSENVLKTVEESLRAFANLSENVAKTLQTLNSHQDLLDRKIYKASIVRDVELIKMFESRKSMLDVVASTRTSEFTGLISQISPLSADFDGISAYCDVIQQIANFPTRIEGATGFINGFPDVIKLKTDVQNTWLKTAIAKYDSELVKAELKPLEQFGASFNSLDGKWKSLSESNIVDQVSIVRANFKETGTASDAAVIGKICDTAKPQKTTAFADDLVKLVGNVLKFRETLSFLKAKFSKLSEMDEVKQLKQLTEFKAKIDFTAPRTLDIVRSELPKKGELAPLIQVLKNLKPVLEDIKYIIFQSSLATLPTEIQSKAAAPGAFVSHADKTEYFTYFESLKQMKPQLEALSKSVTLVRAIRQIKADSTFKASLEGITDKISGSIQDFKALRAVPDTIKSTETERIGELIQLKGIKTDSKKFGEAVAVLDTVQSILSKKSNINILLEYGMSVNKEIDTNSVISGKEKLREGWKPFGELWVYLDSLLSALEAKKGSVNRVRRQLATLHDYAIKLKNLNGLPDSETNLKSMINVLKTVTSAPKSSEMLGTLKELDKLDLEFTSHNSAISNVDGVVKSLEKMLGDIQKPNESPKSTETPETNANVSGNTETYILIAVGGAVVVFGILAAILIARYLKKNMGKHHKEENVALLDFTKLPPKVRKIAEELKDMCQVKLEEERMRKLKPSEEDFPRVVVDIKALEVKMNKLRKELGKKTSAKVEKTAKVEYMSKVEALATARARIEHEKIYDEESLVAKKLTWFDKNAPTPLEMCREKPVWTEKDGKMVPPDRLKDYCFHAEMMMLTYDVPPARIIEYPQYSVILCPFGMRLCEALQIVGEKHEVVEGRMNNLPSNCHTKILCYEHTRVKLPSGNFVNANVFKTPYGVEHVICAAPNFFNLAERVDELIWTRKPAFTVSIFSTKYFAADPVRKSNKYRYELGGETIFYRCAYYRIYIREVKMNNGEETRTMTHFHLNKEEYMSMETKLPKDEEFRKGVYMVLDAVTRRAGKSTIFFDEEGGYFAAMFAGIDLVAASLSTDGIIAADVTTQLVQLLSVRGRMLTRAAPVTFIMYMAIHKFLEDHNCLECINEKWWNDLEVCQDSAHDFGLKSAKIGEKKALELPFVEDESINEENNCFQEEKTEMINGVPTKVKGKTVKKTVKAASDSKKVTDKGTEKAATEKKEDKKEENSFL